MPKVQAPDANPLASRASEPEARVEGSSFHAKTPWLRPGGKSNGTDETRLRPGSQFAEMSSSQSLTQLDSVTWHVTRASLSPLPPGVAAVGRARSAGVRVRTSRGISMVRLAFELSQMLKRRAGSEPSSGAARRSRSNALRPSPDGRGQNQKTNGRTRRCSRLGAPVPDQKDAPGFLPARCVPSCLHQWFQEAVPIGEARAERVSPRLAGCQTAGSAALLPSYRKCRAVANPPSVHQWRHPRLRYQGSEKPLWHNARL
jgi:hypothetical protein